MNEEIQTPGGVEMIGAESVAAVLSEVAEIAAETLELQDVFDRVATAVRRIIPFDNMGVVRIVDGDKAVLHASTVPCRAESTRTCLGPASLTSWSPRMRPRPGPNPRIEDALEELDPDYLFDARALQTGVRSGMWEPFRSSGTLSGGVWLSAYRPRAFSDEHQAMLRPIAALLGSAVEHWRIWDAERRRRERLEKVESLLVTLAGSLDVSTIFEELSRGMKQIVPHDLLSLTELDLQAKTIRLAAIAGEADIPKPPPTKRVPLSQDELDRRIDFEIIHDIPKQLPADTERGRLIHSLGMRSWLRVPLLLSGEVKGSLSFFHRDEAMYRWEDAEVARRLADRIALVLSHRALAEKERVAAETRERAERLEARVAALARELESRDRSRVIGVSSSWKDTLRQVGRVAASDTTVLITGESGTGKEVISSLIHQGSDRAGKAFVAINCAALPEQLLESELFGHERGAFTGATATKIGRIEQAAGGTLFLDEIAEMSPLVQAKLLRVLEEREFQRVGGTRTLQADVRLIAATNRDLEASLERGAFRLDLYYRLNVFQIHITPLRERREDILPLAEVFLEELGKTMARPAAGISRDARDWMLAYHWPGNVRELRNAIERAILLCDGGLITRDHMPAPLVRPGATALALPALAALPPAPAPPVGPALAPPALAAPANGSAHETPASADGLNLDTMERGMLEKALVQSSGNKSKAAKLLGLTRAQLYWRMEKHGLR
jgi:transcriptional regulator with GAF, ATPase, and Fis domain